MSIRSSSEISALRGGEGRCLVPSGISGKIFAIDSLVALTWSWFGAFGDGESWSNYVVDAPEGIADVPSFIEGSTHIGGYYACCALNMVYRNMMLSAEPEDSENLKRVHFGNALMFAGIVLQVYQYSITYSSYIYIYIRQHRKQNGLLLLLLFLHFYVVPTLLPQNYRTRNFIRNPYPFMIMHGILGIVHIIRGVQLHNK